MSRTITRRHLLAVAAAAAATLALAGCGFKLRGVPAFPFRTLQLGAAPRSELGEELRRQLAAAPDLRIVEAAKDAEVVLDVLDDSIGRSVSAPTAAGQVREITVRARLRFRLRTPADRELIPATTLELSQPLSYNESAALGKESEETELVREMRRDLTMQVLRRLAAVEL
ncbi:LPS assembly lipoprotein LptE [Aquabacterium sp. A7-Y]|uniref:LPS-assembly lipoprotein LptE n=1 Tax=Aquabacterium sp. A7-Y TaxID=1349605 RepID=UPI00223D3EC9|nr:LPS assembly lipoprotein LptE [Aquabacterium sp. A7-Y]MCW7536620.1 LPS assembly lipoprotein LptE [Aquabacterium sp. A7-Y]